MVSEISGDQWNEGDVSESVVRRVALADSFYTIDAILRSMKKILSELQVNESAISMEVDREIEYLLSSKVLLIASQKGVGREAAHSLILETATKSRSSDSETFFELLAKNKELDLPFSQLQELKAKPQEHLGAASAQSRDLLRILRAQISHLAVHGNQNLEEISN